MLKTALAVSRRLVLATAFGASLGGWSGARTVFEDREFQGAWHRSEGGEEGQSVNTRRYVARTGVPDEFEMLLETSFRTAAKRTSLAVAFNPAPERSAHVSIDNRGRLYAGMTAFDRGGSGPTRTGTLKEINGQPGVPNVLRIVSRGTAMTVTVNDGPAIVLEGPPLRLGSKSRQNAVQISLTSEVENGKMYGDDEDGVRMIAIKVTARP